MQVLRLPQVQEATALQVQLQALALHVQEAAAAGKLAQVQQLAPVVLAVEVTVLVLQQIHPQTGQ